MPFAACAFRAVFGVSDRPLQQRAAQQLAADRQFARPASGARAGSAHESSTRMNQTVRPDVNFNSVRPCSFPTVSRFCAKAQARSILRREVARGVNALLRLIPCPEVRGCAHDRIPRDQITDCTRGMWRFPDARATWHLLGGGSSDLVAMSQNRKATPYPVVVLGGASSARIFCSFKQNGFSDKHAGSRQQPQHVEGSL